MALTILTNPLEEDPYLYVERSDIKESYLFDCGLRVRGNYRKVRRLWAVCISHAHIDHLVGFDHIVRSLLNENLLLRVFGPKGIIDKLAGKLTAYDWDRAYDQDLVLRVTELGPTEHSSVDFILRDKFHPSPRTSIEYSPVIRSTPTDELRFAIANHGGSPCVSYAYSLSERIKVDKQRLRELGFRDGPWIGELIAWQKSGSDTDIPISVWGAQKSAQELSSNLLFIEKGKKIVYITDTRLDGEVRAPILALAKQADLLFCEATFTYEDQELAFQFHHLIAKEAAEFAAEAQVEKLILNHPSRRYHGNYRQLLKEARAIFPNTEMVAYKGSAFNL